MDYFQYDGLQQLIKENENGYRYDGVENRLDRDVGPCNQLLKCGEQTFHYDSEGRLSVGSDFTCRYDAADRMVSYNGIEYRYDGLNRRISRDGEWFVYDGNREIGRINAQGEWLEFRVLGEGKGGDLGATIAVEIKGVAYKSIADIRGSVAALLDKQGNCVESYRYMAFGAVSTHGVKETGNPWQFHSKRKDEESGWLFFGRRYYCTDQGRFTTPDPLGYESGPNLYTFVHNNPLTHADLYGYRDEDSSPRSRNLIDFGCRAFRIAMGVVEWFGKNLIPIPGVRDIVEGIGRWGTGGKLFALAEYRKCHCGEHIIPGKKVENKTTFFMNGMLNSLDEAKKEAESISKQNEEVEVILLYNSTKGFAMDLITCVLLKVGGLSPPEKLIIDAVKRRLVNSPNELIEMHDHSQAGLHLYNAASQLTEKEKAHMAVYTYGSAKIIPADMFGEVVNYISWLDGVPISDTVNYIMAAAGGSEHVIFLPPASSNPLKEHMFMEKTYQNAMAERARINQRRRL